MPPFRRAVLLLLVALAAPAALAQGAGQPFLRVQVQPQSAIVGQPVKVAVEVCVPNWFLSEPQFPPLDIPDAVAVLPDEIPVNSSERVGGQTFSAIKRTYLVYPQRPGTFTLPPAEVVVTYALPGATPSPPTSLPLPPQRFEATIPPEAAGLGYFLPTTRFAMTQSFDPPLEGLQEGSTFTRTVTATAAQAFAMFIPPARFDCPDGLKLYPKDPVVQDETKDRAGFTGGKRVDAATYLIEKPGTYTLPEISVSWWDLTAGTLRAATLPAVTFTAAPNPGYKPALAPEAPPAAAPVAVETSRRALAKRYALPAGILLAAALAAAWLAIRYGRSLRSSVASWQRRRADGEPACFRKLHRACRTGDPKAAYAALALWVERSGADGGDATISAFSGRCGDDALRDEISRLGSLLYSRGPDPGAWDGRGLIEGLERVRRARRVSRRDTHGGRRLPELNPRGPR
jgi:hypothetical protein